jgi:hypothetical protein
MRLTLGDLFETPDYHFFRFEGGTAVFLPMDAAAYRRSIFLDGRIAPAGQQALKVPLAPLIENLIARGTQPRRIGWIFHVAQCGSTLLARALDQGSALVLREPGPLRQLGVEAGAGTNPAWQSRLQLAQAMAARRYDADRPTIVKATVPVNFMLDQLAALDREAPAILLYYPFEQYLSAVLRTPKHREWVRRVTDELAPALLPEAGAVRMLAEPERAAALWLAQMRRFAATLETMPNSYSLDAALLFGAPRSVIGAAASLFDQPMDPAMLDAVLASDLFATYSKNPSIRFDNRARMAREAETLRALSPEIARARQWLETRLGERPLPARLDRPLAGESPLLL